jgi:penicillin amidase
LWGNFTNSVWEDEFEKAPKVILEPTRTSLLEGVLKDSSYKFLDNIKTPQREKLSDIVTIAFKKAADELTKVEGEGKLEWAKYKATGIKHLTKLAAFSRLNLPVGGGSQSINAVKEDHGPSWRMIVSLTPQTEAYGVYPGGQSGNPGSKFYDNFVDTWVTGKYYRLWVMKSSEKNDKRIKWKMTFSKM